MKQREHKSQIMCGIHFDAIVQHQTAYTLRDKHKRGPSASLAAQTRRSQNYLAKLLANQISLKINNILFNIIEYIKHISSTFF